MIFSRRLIGPGRTNHLPFPEDLVLMNTRLFSRIRTKGNPKVKGDFDFDLYLERNQEEDVLVYYQDILIGLL